MKIRLKQNVKEAALDRIRFLYSEFDNIYLAFSGGKDSTTCLQLALTVATELDRLPLKVIWVDQEAEWQATADYVRTVMNDPRVEPYWLQVPIQLFNSASMKDNWLQCWEEGKTWMREKEPNSIHENIFGTKAFYDMFDAVLRVYHPDERACLIGGVRAEESPARSKGLTTSPKFKGITWAKKLNKGKHPHYSFYPIYDWSYKDVWKYIHEVGCEYCTIYDSMYQHGVAPFQMRVSNLHHSTAIHSLYYLPEIEGKTWDKLTERLGGVHAALNLEKSYMFQAPKKLPWMFKTWVEYRDHLLDMLVINPEHTEIYRKRFARDDQAYDGMLNKNRLTAVQISTILTNDYYFVKLDNFGTTPQAGEFIKWKTGRPIKAKYGTWIPPHELEKAEKAKAN